MSFANPYLLLGLTAVAVPILIHLLTRQRAQRIPWGAMQFLLGSVVGRNRRMLLEDALLLIMRCLLLGLLALALALPFLPRGSALSSPWIIPGILLGAGAIGAGTALASLPRWRWSLYAAGALLLCVSLGFTAKNVLQGAPDEPTIARQDIAIVIDGSASMHRVVEGQSNFDRAKDAARQIAGDTPSGDRISVIVGGSPNSVSLRNPSPRMDDVEQAIAEASLTGGALSVVDAIRTAAATLGEGAAQSRKVVFITDGQRNSWTDGADIDWEALQSALDESGTETSLVVQQLASPPKFRNVQLSEITVPAKMVAAGRETEIEVRVTNTGTEEITEPFDVVLDVDGITASRQSLDKLAVGTSERITFRHDFATSGLHGIEAHAALDDDFAWDDKAGNVVRAAGRLPVLLVEGNPSLRFMDRSSAFLEVALALDASSPESSMASAVAAPQAEAFAVTAVDLPALAETINYDDYQVVILANVPRLPISAAVGLAQFVQRGGSVLVIPGARCEPNFYNQWKTKTGAPVLPAQLVDRHIATSAADHLGVAMGTVDHPALKLVGDSTQADLASMVLSAYWRLSVDENDKSVRVGGALHNGDPLLIERQLGKGRVLLTSVSFDREGGNLPALRVFLPLVHEMMEYLVRLPKAEMEIGPAGGDVRLVGGGSNLSQSSDIQLTGEGLRGEYFSDAHFARPVFTRLDPTIDFQWLRSAPIDDVPADGFSIRWTGTLTPPKSDAYTFTLWGYSTKLWIDGRLIAATDETESAHATTDLVGGQHYAIRVEYQDRTEESACRLFWTAGDEEISPLPAKVLSPGKAWLKNSGELSLAGDDRFATLVGPTAPQPVALAVKNNHVFADVGPVPQPGLYRIDLPAAMRDDFRDLLDAGGVPVAAKPPAEESNFTALSDKDFAQGQEQLPLIVAASTEEVLASLWNPTDGGRPLWKYLAIAALVLAVAEIALTRWIAVQRKLGATVAAEFVSYSTDPGAMRSRAMEAFRTPQETHVTR